MVIKSKAIFISLYFLLLLNVIKKPMKFNCIIKTRLMRSETIQPLSSVLQFCSIPSEKVMIHYNKIPGYAHIQIALAYQNVHFKGLFKIDTFMSGKKHLSLSFCSTQWKNILE